MAELLDLDAAGQAEAVRRGDVSPLDLVDAAIGAIETVDPMLDATLLHRFEAARAEAADVAADAPFGGVPILLKDLLHHMKGEPFYEGCAAVARRGYVSTADTHFVAALRRAGFIVLGKTKCSEFGILPTAEPAMYPPTRNPWDRGHTVMGSSGGSAAAVAARMVAAATGNDLGGSLRTPASACGVVGLKPSRGRTSLAPDFGNIVNDHVVEHVVTRSIRDTAALLDVLSGPVAGDPSPLPLPEAPFAEVAERPPPPLRVGRLVDAPGGLGVVDPACVEAVDATLDLLTDLGHTVEASAPEALNEEMLGICSLHLAAAYAEYALDWWGRELGEALTEDDVEALTWWLAELSGSRSIADYLTTVEWLQAWSRRIARWWEGGFDLLVTPTMAVPPPPIGWITFDPENPLASMVTVGATTPFTMVWNVTGSPAISLPLHRTDEGLPVGVQLVARPGREDVLLAVARQVEAAAPWADLRPPVCAV
ncbi:MAG: amidase [Actinobacteria bacterium]|nr:amidase [Actinomycetota bacterium]